MGKLSTKKVASITKPGRHLDGDNLYLQVGPAGGKSWLLRFMLRGRERHMGLGPVDLVSLAEAREAAFECRRLLFKGIDPIEHRNTTRVPESGITFQECAGKLIESMEAGWRNAKHVSQ